MSFGWGIEEWGAGEWGAGGAGVGAAALRILSAVAIRENVIRLTFNVAPAYTRLLTPTDASNPARFNIVPVAGTVGYDGLPARAVLPALVTVASVPGALGTVLDVTTDRPLSPFPARYIVSANQLETDTGSILDPSASSFQLFGVYRQLRVQSTTDVAPSRDISNPQTYSALTGTVADPTNAAQLGTFPIDASGDYAFDSGVNQLRKRVLRRMVTRPGAFPAMPGYGVGVLGYGSRLSVAGVRQQIADEARRQISSEPDVSDCRVSAASDPKDPNVTVFSVRVRTTDGIDTTFTLPFQQVP
jgi:hypothetical protein